ncbi:MAG: hypothetical protein P8Y53_18315 [Pseudolabrys sp.]
MMDQFTQLAEPGTGRPMLAGARKNPRQIYVAYSPRLHHKAEYRQVFEDLAKAFTVEFVFAGDANLVTADMPHRIAASLRASHFGIFDVSGWDPNVTFEFGLALGLNERACVIAHADMTKDAHTPANLRGIGRVQYSAYPELQDYLFQLLSTELPVPRSHEVERHVEALREHALRLIGEQRGLRIADIANLLGVSVDMAKLIVKPLLGHRVRLEGAARGARYFPVDTPL